MKIAIAADHGGYDLKEEIKNYFTDIEWLDLGTDSPDSVDYPDYAHKMAKTLQNNEAPLGILVCGTGVGISIAANRHKGIRAALIYSDEVAHLAKQHNNANVLVFGGRTMKPVDVMRYINIFLREDFVGERHQRRLDKIEQVEDC